MKISKLRALLKSRWASIAIATLILSCGGGTAVLVKAATLTTTLTYTYSASSTVDASGNWPACSSTVTSTCVSGFKIYQTDVTPSLVVGTMHNPSTPSGSQTFTQDLTDSTLSYGSHQVEATTLYVDSSGAAKETGFSAPYSFVYSAGSPAIVVIKSATAK